MNKDTVKRIVATAKEYHNNHNKDSNLSEYTVAQVTKKINDVALETIKRYSNPVIVACRIAEEARQRAKDYKDPKAYVTVHAMYTSLIQADSHFLILERIMELIPERIKNCKHCDGSGLNKDKSAHWVFCFYCSGFGLDSSLPEKGRSR